MVNNEEYCPVLSGEELGSYYEFFHQSFQFLPFRMGRMEKNNMVIPYTCGM